MMLPAGPKTILSVHRQEPLENSQKTGLSQDRFAQGVLATARSSTHDQQTLSLQRRVMRDYVSRRRWTIAIDIREWASGASVRELRQLTYASTHEKGVSFLKQGLPVKIVTSHYALHRTTGDCKSMLRITIQAAIVVVGLIASIIITNVYYNQTLQYLIHIEQLAHAAIPAVLAVALLYHVINITNRKKRP